MRMDTHAVGRGTHDELQHWWGSAIPLGFQDLIGAPTIQVDATDYVPASVATSTTGAVQVQAPLYNATTDATMGAVVANASAKVTGGGPTAVTPVAAAARPPAQSSTTTAAAKATKAAADKKAAAAKAAADKTAAAKLAAADKATLAKIAAAKVTVKSGDTLSAIARAHGVDLATLEALNKDTIPDPDVISPGQTIKLSADANLKPPSAAAAGKTVTKAAVAPAKTTAKPAAKAAAKPAVAAAPVRPVVAAVPTSKPLTAAQKKSLTDAETTIATANDGINHDINTWFTQSIAPGETDTAKATLTAEMQNATVQQQTLATYLQQIQTMLASGHT